MKILMILAAVIVAFFVVTFGIYWFNLDSKLVKALFPAMTKHYDSLQRDRRLYREVRRRCNEIV